MDEILEAFRKGRESVEKEQERIAPRICPFTYQCIRCGDPANPFAFTKCKKCGTRFKDDFPKSRALIEMENIASIECEKLQKHINSLQHHLTFLYIETTVVLVLYALTMFMN